VPVAAEHEVVKALDPIQVHAYPTERFEGEIGQLGGNEANLVTLCLLYSHMSEVLYKDNLSGL